MAVLNVLACFLSLAAASISVYEPSDTIPSSQWASDNAILADYNVEPVLYQIIPVVGSYVYSGSNSTTISQQTLSNTQNDSSVLVVTDGATADVQHSTIVKFGYASNLLQSSFFGKSRRLKSI